MVIVSTYVADPSRFTTSTGDARDDRRGQRVSDDALLGPQRDPTSIQHILYD